MGPQSTSVTVSTAVEVEYMEWRWIIQVRWTKLYSDKICQCPSAVPTPQPLTLAAVNDIRGRTLLIYSRHCPLIWAF